MVDIQEELEKAGVTISPYFQEKLNYWDTDLCHYANAVLREVQFCRWLTKLPDAATAHTRTAWTPRESAYALHCWHRQLRWHHALIEAAPPAEDSEHPKNCPSRRVHAGC